MLPRASLLPVATAVRERLPALLAVNMPTWRAFESTSETPTQPSASVAHEPVRRDGGDGASTRAAGSGGAVPVERPREPEPEDCCQARALSL